MTCEIRLTDGTTALVDDADFPWLSQHHWSSVGRNAYAATRIDGKNVYMHRLILKPPTGYECDHINGNQRDNRRCNLRACTHGENMRNLRSHRGSSSQFKGVAFNKAKNRWQVLICVDRKQRYIGRFRDEEEAARAYDAAARELFGPYARLNFPNEVQP